MAYDGAVWKDPRPIGRAATIALWGELALVVINLLQTLTFPLWRGRLPPFMARAPWAYSLSYVALFLVGAIVVLMWVYRVCRNTQALGLGANRSAWGALLWYLVPVASLWKPFETFSETWRIAQDPHGWRKASAPPLLLWWWALWLAQGIGAYFVGLIVATFTDGGFSAQVLDAVVSNGITIAYILLFLSIVARLTAMQTTSRAEDVFD